MGVLVATGDHDRGQALLGHAHELVRVRGGPHGIDGDLDVAIRAVLEANRHREARRQVAVHLALGRARADGAPRHGVGDELRGDRVKELATRRDAQLHHIEQELASHGQSLVDRKAAVQVRIVDQPLPADRGARLLEVDPHHDAQIRFQLVGQWRKLLGVAPGGVGVVDRARPHDHNQTVIQTAQDAADLTTRALHQLRAFSRQRQLLDQDRRRHQWPDAGNAQIARFRRTLIACYGDMGHPGQSLQRVNGVWRGHAHGDHDLARLRFEDLGVIAGGHRYLADRVYLFLGCFRAHHHQHRCFLSILCQPADRNPSTIK